MTVESQVLSEGTLGGDCEFWRRHSASLEPGTETGVSSPGASTVNVAGALQSSTAAARRIVWAEHQEAHPPDPDSPPVCAPGNLVLVKRHDPGTLEPREYQAIGNPHQAPVYMWEVTRTLDGKTIGRVTTSGAPTIGADLCKIFGEGWNRPPTTLREDLEGPNIIYVLEKDPRCGSEEDYFCASWGCETLACGRQLTRHSGSPGEDFGREVRPGVSGYMSPAGTLDTFFCPETDPTRAETLWVPYVPFSNPNL
ncbi:hypothetical protein QTO34_014241 [Cnephaeus nilssonii]|uniref:Uncharacterized protein n=1 Tax=Cnephaeus nilssonii TaxID=3371016 RepID=A0AA40I5Z9_CNENI|nr:hypothetical protein QTO34_014241 [Eptesicus nilssonii]